MLTCKVGGNIGVNHQRKSDEQHPRADPANDEQTDQQGPGHRGINDPQWQPNALNRVIPRSDGRQGAKDNKPDPSDPKSAETRSKDRQPNTKQHQCRCNRWS